MKGEVITRLGTAYDGKFSVAVFVLGLDTNREALELAPILQERVTAAVQEKVRHGLHTVPKQDNDTDFPPSA